MSKQRILCPECQAPLNIDASLPAGKKIKCPKCQAIFPLGERVSEAVSAEPMAVAVAADADDEDDRDVEDDRSARRDGGRREKQSMGAGMTITMIAASLLIAGGLAVGTYYLVKALVPGDAGSGDQAAAEPAAPEKWQPTGLLAKGMPPQLTPPKDKQAINPNKPNATAGPKIGDVAPEIVAEDLDGQTFKLSDYRGKVVLLDFWGNW
jgi:predicted Zn finger-like uncharacterized protein